MKINCPVYIITVNFGNWKDTAECLRSIEASSGISLSVIIIDILNIGGSVAKLEETITGLSDNQYRIIQLHENLGFAHACNKGIRTVLKETRDCYIWLLNNDTLITPETLNGLVSCYEGAANSGQKTPGFIGSTVVDYDNPGKIQYAGGITDSKRARFSVVKEGDPLQSIAGRGCTETDWVMGASMFFHASLLEDIGYMPEEYFLYYEDIDWSLRAIRKGYANHVSSESIVIHKQGSSTGQDYNSGKRINPVTTRYFYSSYLKFFRINFPEKYALALLMLLKQAAGKLVRGDTRRARILLHVLAHNLLGKNK